MARKPRVDSAPTTSDAVEIAMEADAANTTPDSPARQVLLEQVRLIRAQRRSENFGSALKILTGVAGLAVVLALGWMIWSAAHADGVVIHAFDTPPSLVAEGVTGDVLAGEFLDQITVLETGSRSAMARRSTFEGALGREIRVEIPQTGVALGDLDRVLRGWLGHERALTGALTQRGDQITLTVRLAGAPPVVVSGLASERPDVVRRVAEQIYSSADPLRFAFYLRDQGRGDELAAALVRLRSTGTLTERAQGFLISANFSLNPEESLRLAREGITMDPDYPLGQSNLMAVLGRLGRWEEADRAAVAATTSIMRPQTTVFWPGALETRRYDVLAGRATYRGDYAKAFALTEASANTAFTRARPSSNLEPNLALSAAQGHDMGLAASLMGRAALRGPTNDTWRQADGRIDLLAGRAGAAVEKLSADLLIATPNNRIQRSTWLARAMAEAGDVVGAQTLIGGTPLNCYPCLIARARVAALAGDAAGADRWFAEAVRQGPSFPIAEAEWGEVLLARGDLAAAIAKFEAAYRKGPKFADPISGWGEALLKQGQTKAAVRKFREADKYAPKWGRNHLLWGEALVKLGKAKEARAQFALAAGLYLTAPERARLPSYPRR